MKITSIPGDHHVHMVIPFKHNNHAKTLYLLVYHQYITIMIYIVYKLIYMEQEV